MLFPTLGPSSLPVVMAQSDERHANRTASVLEWCDRHRAFYSATSRSNEKESVFNACYRAFDSLVSHILLVNILGINSAPLSK